MKMYLINQLKAYAYSYNIRIDEETLGDIITVAKEISLHHRHDVVDSYQSLPNIVTK